VKDPTGVAALYLGKREGNDLVYMGKVGTGWSRTKSSQIRKQLDTVVSPKSELTKPIKKLKATWVEPSFTAEVEFRDITSERLLRQSSFKGLSKEHPQLRAFLVQWERADRDDVYLYEISQVVRKRRSPCYPLGRRSWLGRFLGRFFDRFASLPC
jgi:ATP-dependent DNA ligase